MSSNKRVSAEEALRSFNTWAFKREQPSDPLLMQRVISESIAVAEPISFTMYWGKGLRERLDAPDIACLDYLASLCQRVGTVYAPGATFRLIFTDTHARLNGHTPMGTQRYFSAVEARARRHGFSTCLLGQLVEAASGETPSEPVTEIPEDIRQLLIESAAKWYRGEGSVEYGALKYYQGNMVEKQAVEFAFPRSIFVTFNGSKLLNLFPSRLPIFYMYSLRRGFSIKPWFLSLDAGAEDGSARRLIA
jgi:L-tyrosine isonitrile synthase